MSWKPPYCAPKNGAPFLCTAMVNGQRRYAVARVTAPWKDWKGEGDDYEIMTDGLNAHSTWRLSKLDGIRTLHSLAFDEQSSSNGQKRGLNVDQKTSPQLDRALQILMKAE